jgi:hypothetical protein
MMTEYKKMHNIASVQNRTDAVEAAFEKHGFKPAEFIEDFYAFSRRKMDT